VTSIRDHEMDVDTARARSRIYAQLAQGFSGPEEGLEAEYARLFVGPGKPIAHPYESVHRERRMMGDCALVVRSLYAGEGLIPEANQLPDHAAVELEFMAHLTQKEAEAWEQDQRDSARDCLRQQESFLHDHLGRWLPAFCQSVLAGEADPFYADLAHQAWDHVARDVAHVRRWVQGAASASVEMRSSWVVSVTDQCTLCGSCTQLCEPRALSLTAEEGETRLVFTPGVCDGCCACQQWCPERAVTVERAGRRQEESVLLRSSALATCPRCGAPSVPVALLERVQERAAADDERLRRRLTMCARCKVILSGTSRAEEE
jgi:TorA maturation chaperone TorD/NAD-dependent dihydropyrimidine dehydrogenase PreA subunit